MTLYLDASVIVPLLIRERASPSVTAALRFKPRPLFISEFAAGEVASALSRLVRNKDISSALGIAQLATFDEWRAGECQTQSIDDEDILAAANLVRRFELMMKMPDALHAVVARRHGHDIVTRDIRLAAASRALSVSVIFPD